MQITNKIKKSFAMILSFALILTQLVYLPANAQETRGKDASVKNVVVNNYNPKKVILVSGGSADSRYPSVAGTEFKVYKSPMDARADRDSIQTLVIRGENGNATASTGERDLPEGTYYVKETKATKGYKLSDKIHTVTVKDNEMTGLEVANELEVATPKVEKTSDVQTVRIGDKVRYTVTAVNDTENGTAYDFSLNDELKTDKARMVASSVRADINGTEYTDVTVTDSTIATGKFDLAPKSTMTLTYEVELTGRPDNGVLENTISSGVPKTIQITHNIITEVVNGTIDPNQLDIPDGQNKTINYAPKDGYELEKIEVDGVEVPITDNIKDSYNFDNIQDNHRIKVTYKGTPKVEDPTKTFDKNEYHKGDTVKNTIGASNKGVADSIAENVIITDENKDGFSILTDTVKAVIEGEHSTAPVVEKTENGFKVTVEKLYGGEKVKITFDSVTTGVGESFTNTAKIVHNNKELEASATARNVYKITTEVVNGTIDEGSTNIPNGTDKTVNFAPKEGYELDRVEIDGTPTTLDNPNAYTFTNITDNHHIKVVYKGTNKPDMEKTFDKDEYKLGETVKNTITIKNDGNKDAVMKNVVLKDENQSGLTIDTSTIKVAYNKLDGKTTEPVVNVVNAENGEFTVTIPELSGTESVVVTFDSRFTTNVETITNTATLVDEEQNVIPTPKGTATAVPVYKITTEVVNGVISKGTEVRRGGDTEVTYTPNDGYEIEKIEVNGKDVPVTDENKTKTSFTNVTEDKHIKVTYKGTPKPEITKTFDREIYHIGDKIKATIKVKDLGKTGAISKNLVVSDLSGKGWNIDMDSVKAEVSASTLRETYSQPNIVGKTEVTNVNGETVQKNGFDIELADLDTSQELTITFDMEITGEVGDIKNTANLITKEYPNGFNSTATSELLLKVVTEVIGGTITPSTDNVKFGGDSNVEYKPNDNYYLHSIVVDGVNIELAGKENNYEFAKMERDHHIKVEYRKIPTPEITKTTDKTDYVKGETVKYTVEVVNKTDAIAEDVVVNDVMDKAKIEEGLIKINQDSIKVNGQKADSLSNIKLGALQPGQKVAITYEATVLGDTNNTVKNTASVIAKGMTKEIVTENTVNIHEVPKLSISKTSDKDSYKKDEHIKYTVKVTNNGKFDVTNATLKDQLKGESAKNVKILKETAKINGKEVDFDNLKIDKLAPGETITLTYEALVLENVDSVIDNEVTLNADYLKDKDGKETPLKAERQVKTEMVKTPEAPATGDHNSALAIMLANISVLGLLASLKKRSKINQKN